MLFWLLPRQEPASLAPRLPEVRCQDYQCGVSGGEEEVLSTSLHGSHGFLEWWCCSQAFQAACSKS